MFRAPETGAMVHMAWPDPTNEAISRGVPEHSPGAVTRSNAGGSQVQL